VRALVDTHALLWYLLDDPRLSGDAASAILDLHNEILVSPASYWEIAIKVSVGRYMFKEDFETFMERAITTHLLTILPISVRHAAAVAAMPLHHKDPFDRLLVAQATVEQIPILSSDAVLDRYGVTRIW
jgi:PIN domain nuclease of toxin-antitoxin system